MGRRPIWCTTLSASEVTSETRGWGVTLRHKVGEVRGCATLMVASEVTSEIREWGV